MPLSDDQLDAVMKKSVVDRATFSISEEARQRAIIEECKEWWLSPNGKEAIRNAK